MVFGRLVLLMIGNVLALKDVYEWLYVWVLVISKLDVCEGECL